MGVTGDRVPILVMGAGPAGLGAAYKLAQNGNLAVTVLERNRHVGGNAGSFEVGGLSVDYGSHRLHPSCDPDVLSDIRLLLGPDLLDRPRHGRIRLQGRWLHFPLKPVDLALHAPPSFLLGVSADALARRRPENRAESFASVLESGLGRTICRDFYFPYARKIWGISPDQLDPEQARRRVSAGSMQKLVRKVLNSVPGFKPAGAGRFFYPRKGYGQISDAFYRAAVEAGAAVLLGAGVSRVELSNGRASSVVAVQDGTETRFHAAQILSTIPLTALVRCITPPPPDEVMRSADALRYRAMILVYLVLATDRFSEFDAHYFPEAEVAITRLSEPKNYGLAELPGKTVLCAELPCSTEDAVWEATDPELGQLVQEALARAGVPVRAPVRSVTTRRLSHAYPVYSRGYREHFDRIDRWLSGIDGLFTLGRQGLFVHDNTHHTLAMAYAACRCLDSEGKLDREQWLSRRREFESFVVED